MQPPMLARSSTSWQSGTDFTIFGRNSKTLSAKLFPMVSTFSSCARTPTAQHSSAAPSIHRLNIRQSFLLQ